MKRGKLFAFEGIDQSGKETQAKRLRERLLAKGEKVLYLSFPDYKTPIGAMLDAFLHGNTKMNPYVRHLLYAANRFEYYEEIKAALVDGQIVVCDRYTESGVAYGIANKLSQDWLYELERDLPRADMLFFLQVEPEEAVARKGVGRDIYETNLGFLRECNQAYEHLCEVDHRWNRIDACQDIATLSEIVYQKASGLLKE